MRTRVAALVVMLAGCQAGAPPQTSAARSAGTLLSLTTNQTSYTIGESVQVNFDGFPPNALDWIALALDGSAATSFLSYQYTGGTVGGTLSFVATQPGTLVMRGYFNDGAVIQVESQPFTVSQGAGATVTTTQAVYDLTSNITVNYSNLNGSYTDWIALADANGPPNTFVDYQYKGFGGPDGSKVFGPLPAGSYVARAYYSNTYIVAGVSAPFTVGTVPGVTTNQSAYVTGQQVVVNWTALPGGPQDWIGIAVAGSPLTSYVAWHYTDGNPSGQLTFPGTLQPGTYVARSFANNSFELSAESAEFTVANSTATTITDSASYVPGQDINVTYTGLLGTPRDWAAVALEGSALSSFLAWKYTPGTVNGAVSFAGTFAPGSYVIRTFSDNSLQLAAESAPFTVGASTATISTNLPGYPEGADIVVNYAGLPGSPTDWIAVVQDGAPVSSYVDWHYTGGGANGTTTFGALYGPGVYRVRAFANSSFNMVAESTPFTISTAPPPTVNTDATAYNLGDPVTFFFSGMPGSQTDWFGLAPFGSPDMAYLDYRYTNGATSGQFTFPTVPTGTYVIRAYFNNTMIRRAESAPFTVTDPNAP